MFQLAALFNALPGSIAQGLIWGIMAVGVYITYKVLDYADLTVDGSIATGGAVAVMVMLSGRNVYVALLAATLAGMAAGLATGISCGFRYPGDTFRHPEPAGAVFYQYAYFGEIQSGYQCRSI